MSSVIETPKIVSSIPSHLRCRNLTMDSSDKSIRDIQKVLQTSQKLQFRAFHEGDRVKMAKSLKPSDSYSSESIDSFEELVNIVQQPRRNMPDNVYSSNPYGSRPNFGPLQMQAGGSDSGRDTASSHQYEDLTNRFTEVGDNLKKMADALALEKGRRFGRRDRDRLGTCCKVADYVS